MLQPPRNLDPHLLGVDKTPEEITPEEFANFNDTVAAAELI